MNKIYQNSDEIMAYIEFTYNNQTNPLPPSKKLCLESGLSRYYGLSIGGSTAAIPDKVTLNSTM
jgi:hypothetical protein